MTLRETRQELGRIESTVAMIAGLQFLLYLLSELYRRVVNNGFTARAIRGEEDGGNDEDLNRLGGVLDEDETGSRAERLKKMKEMRAKPSMVNVTRFGQCIAVLTSGGDAQGL